MAQIKIYGERGHLRHMRTCLSDAIHAVSMDVLGLPRDKRFHRFIGLDSDDFIYPPDRTQAYNIVEISLFEGRSVGTRHKFLRSLMCQIVNDVGITPIDLEITLFETPKSHWGIRGKLGDELSLDYKVEQ